MDIRRRIKDLCRSRGVSINALEKACGFAPGSIAHWDSKIPSVERVETVANYFHVSVDFLLGRTIPASEVSGVSGAYLSLARSAEESGLAPEDVQILLDAVKQMKSR